jgi:hypothetical protein
MIQRQGEMKAMQQTQAIVSDESRLRTFPTHTLVALFIMMGAAMGSASAADAEPAKETPLVSCMVKKASPENKETVAKAIQEGFYCPPPQLHPNQVVACPPEENHWTLVKRAVFDLAKECSKEFRNRESLPSIEEAFIASLRKDDTVKDAIEKRKAAYEKSKADFEKTRAGDTAVSKQDPSLK